MEVIATTDSALDKLEAHAAIRNSGWKGRVIPTFRPDAVVDPEFAGFRTNLAEAGAPDRRGHRELEGLPGGAASRGGASSSSKARPRPTTGIPRRRRSTFPGARWRRFSARVTRTDEPTPADAELFRAQMLSEMARMSVEDGLVMQLHVGSFRNYNPVLFAKWGRDQGADIPTPTDYVHALHPLLARYGNEPDFRLILFTLDESAFSRELAPLAGHYPSVILGPPWWFLDSPDAASANGGVFRTDDGGMSWRSLMDAFNLDPANLATTTLTCGAIAIDGNDPNRVYVGTGEGNTNHLFSSRIVNSLPAYRGVGPLRSDDGGSTWNLEPSAAGSPSLAGKAFFALAVDPANRENVVGATNNGLYQRVPKAGGGAEWVKRRNGIHSSVVASASGATKFFAAEWGKGVYQSGNGTNWSLLGSGFPSGDLGRIGLWRRKIRMRFTRS